MIHNFVAGSANSNDHFWNCSDKEHDVHCLSSTFHCIIYIFQNVEAAPTAMLQLKAKNKNL